MSVRRWRKVLSLCLAAAMVATMFPVGASAAPKPVKPPVGTIQGSVTGFDGIKVAGVKVVAYTMVGEFSPDYHAESVAEVTTSKRGTYTLELTPGTYRLGFFPSDTARYAWEFFSDASMAWQGQDIVVVAKGKATANAQLVEAGRISGTVVDDEGVPMVGVDVQLNQMWPETLRTVMSVTSGPDGSFSFTGLPMDAEYSYGLWADDPSAWHVVSDNLWNSIDTAGKQVTDVVLQMEAAGQIIGTVLNESDEPVAGVEVTPYSWSEGDQGGGQWEPMWWNGSETDTDGTYVIGALAAGTYVVRFSDPQGRYAQVFYAGKIAASVADEVVVIADEQASGTDAVLSAGGVISGTVSTPDGPYTGPAVRFEVWADDHYEEIARAECDENGDYSARLPFGSYRVHFACEDWRYVSEYWNDTRAQEDATPVELTAIAPLVTGIDATLARPSYITGRVTDENGDPLQGIGVGAHVPSPDGDWFEVVSGADTDETGFYRIPVGIGAYRITFDDAQGTYVSEAYNDKQGGPESGEDVFVVTEEQVVTGIDATLAEASHIRGRVTDEGGQPISGMGVAAGTGPEWWEHVAWAETDSDGYYDLVVASGTYRVNFTDWNQIGFLDEWYDDVTDPEAGTSIAIAAGETVSAIDATLSAGAHIRGRVTNLADEGLQGIGVAVHLPGADPEEGPQWIAGNETDENGDYDVLVPLDTDVILHFEDYNTNTYLDEWYDDVRDWTQATPLAASAGAPLEGIDAVLTAGAHISGRVVNESGEGIAGAGVGVHAPPADPSDPWSWPSWVSGLDADENGYYDVLVPEGEGYLVYFQDRNSNEYLPEWYEDQAQWRQATAVSAFANAPAQVDATLAAGAHIRGRVVDENGIGIQGAAVGVNVVPDPNDPEAQPGEGVSGAGTDSEGYYDVLVPAGTYIVQLGDWYESPPRYLMEWFNDQEDWHLATQVVTAPGAPAENVNATLATASHIRGRVVDGNGNGIAGVNAGIAVHGAQPWMWEFMGGSQTDGDGYYDIPARAGTYHLQFSSWTPDPTQQPWATEWYHESMTADGSDEVVVAVGETVELLTNVMVPPGFVTGRVTDAVTGEGVDGIGVTAVVDGLSAGEWWNVTGAMTSGGGYYTLVCHPGQVRIGAMNPNYTPTWYPSGTYPGGGALLEVQSGVTLSPIDFELVPNSAP